MPNQKDYKLIQDTEQERKLLKKCNKLRRYKLFQNCYNDQLKLLLKNMTKLSLVKKQHLYLEGDQSEYVYLFQKGQIALKKNIVINELELDDPWRENQKLLATRAFQQKNIELAEMNPYDILGIDEIFNSQQFDLDRKLQEEQDFQDQEIKNETNNIQNEKIIDNRYFSIFINSDFAVFKAIKKDFFLTFAQNNNLIKELYSRSEDNQKWINQLITNFQKVYSVKKQYMIQLKQGDRDSQLVHIENHLIEKQKKESDKQIFFLVRPEIQMYQRIKRVRAKSESEYDKRLQKKLEDLSKPVSVKQNSELHSQLIQLFTKKRKEANEKELRVNLYVNSSVKFYKDRDNQRRQTKYQSTGTFRSNTSSNQTPSPLKKQTPKNKPNNSGLKSINQFYSQYEQANNDHSFSQNCQNVNSSKNHDNSLIQLYKNQERAYTPSLNGRINLSTNKTPQNANRPSSNIRRSFNNNTEYLLCSDLIKEDQRFSSNLQNFDQLIRGSLNSRIIDESDEDFTTALQKHDFSGKKNKRPPPNSNKEQNTNLDIKSLLSNKKIKNILSQIYDTRTVKSREQTENNQIEQICKANDICQNQITAFQDTINTRPMRTKSMNTDFADIKSNFNINKTIYTINTRQMRTKSINTDFTDTKSNFNINKTAYPPIMPVSEEQLTMRPSVMSHQTQNKKINEKDQYVKITSQDLKIPISSEAEKQIEIKMRSQLIMKQLDVIKQKAMLEKRQNKSKDIAFNSISVTDIQRSIRDDNLEGNQRLQSNLDKLLNYFDQQQIRQSRQECNKSIQKAQENKQINNYNNEVHDLKSSIKMSKDYSKQQIQMQQQAQLKIIEKLCPLNPMTSLTKFKLKQKQKGQQLNKY